MKIGTLTLHLPFNYGNALQMLSLHKYLQEQGYDAEVLSHWYFPKRAEVLHFHNRNKTFKGGAHFLLDLLTFGGVFYQYRREAKLDAWLKSKLRWSEEAGATGEFSPARLPHDVVIVGSDQIWNPIHKTSEFFLLPDFPDRIRRIAYAASFGTDRFVESRKAIFGENLKRFRAISVRESSAVQMVNEVSGMVSELVCDPTLLHTKTEWCQMLDIRPSSSGARDLVVYFVTPDYWLHWRELIALAKDSGQHIHWFCFQWSQWLPTFDIHRPFSSSRLAIKNIVKRVMLYASGVRLHFAATPSEFVDCLARSEGLITDSFHGMMFATIFEKKCNVVIGEHAERQQMSARLRNFTADFGSPEILTPKPDVSAMKKLSITPSLEKLIEKSKTWLKDAIEGSNA